jgi:hypothetical protein
MLVVFLGSGVHAEYHHVDDCSVCHYAGGAESSTCRVCPNDVMIKCEINTPNSGPRDTVFGPYVWGFDPYNGVCEVCHTATAYHRNDASGNHSHYAGETCSVCHKHSDQFTHGGGESCDTCHGYDGGAGTSQSHSTHTENDSDDLKGPHADCSECHDTGNFPDFADGLTTLAGTTVCSSCHSPGGSFDGVNDPVIGAKASWESGVYEADAKTLKTGKEKWCATCHDQEPAYSKGEVIDPIIMDDTDADFVCSWGWRDQEGGYYGTNYRYHAAGDGSCAATWRPTIPEDGKRKIYAWWQTRGDRASNAPYTIYYDSGSQTVPMDQRTDWDQWNYVGEFLFVAGDTGYVQLSDGADMTVTADAVMFDGPGAYAPNVCGDNATFGYYVTGHKISCTYCHDPLKGHIDHEERTYEADESTMEALSPYTDSYRLRDVEGKPAMVIPRPLRGAGADPMTHWQDFALCFDCHDRNEVLGDTTTTNFWHNDTSPANSHDIHLGISSKHFDSDWDSGHGSYGAERNDSSETCTACHNVHGSPTRVMIRHGELTSSHNVKSTATWSTPAGFSAGTYYLYARWTEDTSRATNARYTVYHAGGEDVVFKSQQTQGGEWVLLGTYDFIAGTANPVVLDTEYADGYVIADAMGWDSDGALDPDPEIILDNPEASLTGNIWVPSSNIAGYYGSDYYAQKQMRNKIPSLNFKYLHAATGEPDPTATLAESIGGSFDYGTGQTTITGVCRACHPAVSYERPPRLNPHVLRPLAEPSAVDNNGATDVLFTAFVYDPDDNLATVTIDLSSIDRSAVQAMYDDGTNGDVTPGDKLYSYQTTIPPTATVDFKTLTVTATDTDTLTAEGDVELMVAFPGFVLVDNQAADFVGYWGTSDFLVGCYGMNYAYDEGGNDGDTATCTPAITQAGNYRVYARWTEKSNRASNAPYTISYDGGTHLFRVDQRSNGGQFNFLGTYHFSAQTAPVSVIVDDTDAVYVGTWSVGGTSESYNTDNHYHEAGTGANMATYTPDLPQAGDYDVYAWWTVHSNRATNAPYTINHNGGSDTVLINQELGGGGWTYLDTYAFNAGTGGSVLLTDEADEYVIADAVKFQLSEAKQKVVLGDDADGYVIADAILFEPEF